MQKKIKVKVISEPAVVKITKTEAEPVLDFIYEKYPAYRILKPHELLEIGDEYQIRSGKNEWTKTHCIGMVVGNQIYRRRAKK